MLHRQENLAMFPGLMRGSFWQKIWSFNVRTCSALLVRRELSQKKRSALLRNRMKDYLRKYQKKLGMAFHYSLSTFICKADRKAFHVVKSNIGQVSILTEDSPAGSSAECNDFKRKTYFYMQICKDCWVETTTFCINHSNTWDRIAIYLVVLERLPVNMQARWQKQSWLPCKRLEIIVECLIHYQYLAVVEKDIEGKRVQDLNLGKKRAAAIIKDSWTESVRDYIIIYSWIISLQVLLQKLWLL